MKNQIDIKVIVDVTPNAPHNFCHISIETPEGVIENPGAWSIVNLVIGSIEDLIRNITAKKRYSELAPWFSRIENQLLIDYFNEWQWGSGEWKNSNEPPPVGLSAIDFFALPIGTELFDGEVAYLFKTSKSLSRLIWIDYETKDIKEISVDFDEYINSWRDTLKLLEDQPPSSNSPLAS